MWGGGRVGQAAAIAPIGGALADAPAGGRQSGRPEALPAAAFPTRSGGREGDLRRFWPRPWPRPWPCSRKSVVGFGKTQRPCRRLPPFGAPQSRGPAAPGRCWGAVGRRSMVAGGCPPTVSPPVLPVPIWGDRGLVARCCRAPVGRSGSRGCHLRTRARGEARAEAVQAAARAAPAAAPVGGGPPGTRPAPPP